jgi:hypothetical protein
MPMKYSLALAASSFCLMSTFAGAANDDAQAWPTTRSKAPTKADWRATPTIQLPRSWGEKARSCDVKRIEEWLYVRCASFKAAAITELSGSRADVSYFIEPAGADRLPGAGQVVVPLRPGERRVFSFWTFGPGYDGPLTVVPAVVLQTAWAPAGAHPVITLTDALHEPVATKTHPRPTPTKER